MTETHRRDCFSGTGNEICRYPVWMLDYYRCICWTKLGGKSKINGVLVAWRYICIPSVCVCLCVVAHPGWRVGSENIRDGYQSAVSLPYILGSPAQHWRPSTGVSVKFRCCWMEIKNPLSENSCIFLSISGKINLQSTNIQLLKSMFIYALSTPGGRITA